MSSSTERLRQAVALARDGRKVEARDLLLGLVDEDPQNEMAWMWLSGLVDSLDDRIIACENILTINPSNERARVYLRQLLAEQNQAYTLQEAVPPASDIPHAAPSVAPPLRAEVTADSAWEWARQYEMEGQFDRALETYRTLAAHARDTRTFDRIYKEITRIEGLQSEKIAYVAPSSAIFRMALGWPLLYLSLVFVQAGGKFFSYPAWWLWLGLPFVAFGGFLMALSEVNARNLVWKFLFNEESARGSTFARFMAVALGWLLILIPLLALAGDSLLRLRDFDLPVY